MAQRRPVVVLVEQDQAPRTSLASWLERAGMTVLACPGPQPPSYTCAGGRGQRCPLADQADLVVLDLCLASDALDDALADGTSASELLCCYLALGKPVVALARPGSSISPYQGEGVVAVDWPGTPAAVVRAVHMLRAQPAMPGRPTTGECTPPRPAGVGA